MESLTVTCRVDGSHTVVTLAGELTIVSVQLADQAIHRARAEHGGHLVFDLEPLAFLDSMGLRTLVKFCLAAEGRGGSAVVAGPFARPVARVLEATGLDRHLPMHATLADALSTSATAAAREAMPDSG